MGGLSIWHILIFAAVALLLFGGRGKISDLMGDVAKGITSFRKGLDKPDDHPGFAATRRTRRTQPRSRDADVRCSTLAGATSSSF